MLFGNYGDFENLNWNHWNVFFLRAEVCQVNLNGKEGITNHGKRFNMGYSNSSEVVTIIS